MMDINVKHDEPIPIYQQIVDQLRESIENGTLPPQTQLPTVRDFAQRKRISKGTVKHAYDTLEKEGLIKMVQGSGSYVCYPDAPSNMSRVEGMNSLDKWIDDMLERSFSLVDIRAMMEERFRARKHMNYTVRVAAVDCTPEAQAVMHQQFIRIPHVEVSDYLLESVLESPRVFDPDADIIVTTPTHFDDLLEKTNPRHHIIKLVLAIATGTALELAAIPSETSVGILCVSRRFGGIIQKACAEYASLDFLPQVACADDPDSMHQLAQSCDQLIFAPNFHLFVPSSVHAALWEMSHKRQPITYQYKIERGSLLFLEEHARQIYENHQRRGAEAEL